VVAAPLSGDDMSYSVLMDERSMKPGLYDACAGKLESIDSKTNTK
jgi:hypothetical protein